MITGALSRYTFTFDRSKAREKQLETELARLAGENWQVRVPRPFYSCRLSILSRPRQTSILGPVVVEPHSLHEGARRCRTISLRDLLLLPQRRRKTCKST